ncbi:MULTISPECIES: AN1-type zinc finger domain-containing protein [unclassified Methanoregula]|uniref:AN1-type zinc finger domain-containing protein n=1 Tax=unclassified Methanoregula TaxID=2649730 RepID=UPI0025D52321|nr:MULTISPECIES: AN1-type zinc finger protein [unclassified Methanoregula]
MAHCDKCKSEVLLPFTCQYCGGKYCAGCRLPPNHECAGLARWNAKPRPAAGMSYSKGGGITPTGGTAPVTRKRAEKRTEEGFPYLKIMIAAAVIILLGLAWLALSGYRM